MSRYTARALSFSRSDKFRKAALSAFSFSAVSSTYTYLTLPETRRSIKILFDTGDADFHRSEDYYDQERECNMQTKSSAGKLEVAIYLMLDFLQPDSRESA